MAFIPAESCEGYSEANLPFPAAKNRGAGFWVWRKSSTLTFNNKGLWEALCEVLCYGFFLLNLMQLLAKSFLGRILSNSLTPEGHFAACNN